MAANLHNNTYRITNYQGAQVENFLERRGLKLLGFGMPTWLWYGRSLGHFAHGRVVHKSHASIAGLQLAISNNKLPVVAVSWQSTREIFCDIRHARVGHYMVAVGFDPQNERILFLNPGLPATEGASRLYSLAYQEFDKIWNGTGNIFIQPGSMWIIAS
jgi:hypothetical protein